MNWLTRIIDKLLTDPDADCPACEGDGNVLKDTAKDDGHAWVSSDFEKCPSCNGTGRVTHERRAELLAEAAKEGWK